VEIDQHLISKKNNMYWYLNVLKQYTDFKGRARRKEYWMFLVFNTIFAIAALSIDNIVGTTFGSTPYGIIYLLYFLAVLIPGISVAIRRLHDIGKSGSMIFILLIPIAGIIWFLILMVTESQIGDNEFGRYPK
jgi:uncharacterized membrane protein YhaH (DUF805 family)